MSWLVEKAISDFFEKLVENAINLFMQFLAFISGVAAQVLDMPVVTSAIVYTQSLAGSILVAKVAFEAWTTYILRINGDPDADPGGLLFRSAAAAAVIAGVPWLVRWIYLFGTTVASDIARLPGVDYSTMGVPLQMAVTAAIRGHVFPIFVAVPVIFALVMLVVIFIQMFIRAAELAVTAVVGSFMALGLTNRGSQSYGMWFRELVSISFSQAIQIFLIKVSFISLTAFDFADVPLFNIFLFCGFLWVTYKSPTILKQYAYSTGVARAAGGVAQSAGSMMLMRRIFTKGV